jgi:hypothetical protein
MGKSYWRLFREFPIVLQCLFLLAFCGIPFFFVEIGFAGSFTNYAVVLILFVLIARRICRISASERVLLSLLRMPVFRIKAIKCVLLSLFFFFLDMGVGVLLLTLGTLTVVFSPEKVKRNKAFPSFYAPSSYQWLGMYRQSGVWVLVAGFLFLLIGLWHHNTNIVCFFLGWIILVPCFLAYYNADPPQLLVIYKDRRYLIWKKGCELIFNITIPLFVSLMIVLTVDFAHAGLYLRLAFLFVYISLLLFYSRYISYPHTLTAFVLSAILIVISAILLMSYLRIATVLCFLVLPLLHFLAVSNLKTFLSYGKD